MNASTLCWQGAFQHTLVWGWGKQSQPCQKTFRVQPRSSLWNNQDAKPLSRAGTATTTVISSGTQTVLQGPEGEGRTVEQVGGVLGKGVETGLRDGSFRDTSNYATSPDRSTNLALPPKSPSLSPTTSCLPRHLSIYNFSWIILSGCFLTCVFPLECSVLRFLPQ